MRYIAMIITLLSVGLVSVGFTNQTIAAQKLKPWQSKMLKLMKKEKQVINAWWRDPVTNQLYISMKPDGTRRDGFAQYICLVMPDAGAPKNTLKTIWIYDPTTFSGYKNHTGNGNPIGMAACR